MSLPEKNTARRKWVGLAIFIAVALIVGQIGGLITRGPVETWYPTLNKPSYNPPDWVFPVAWTANMPGWRSRSMARSSRSISAGQSFSSACRARF